MRTLRDLDLHHYWLSGSVSSDWRELVRAKVARSQAAEEITAVTTQSSLASYSLLEHSFSHGVPPYLADTYNNLGTRLKMHLRLGTLMLMQRLG